MKIDSLQPSTSWDFPRLQVYNHRKIGEYMHDVYPENFFSFVIDAGARGIVHPWHVPQMATKNPQTTFFALEVDLPYYEELKSEIEDKSLNNVILTEEGLGTGETISSPDSKSVKTKTLKQIIEQNSFDVSKRWAFKCDIEGGEECFFEDPDSEEILKKCDHIGIELHFPNIKDHNFFTSAQSDTLMKESRWEAWLLKTLDETHYVFLTDHPKCQSVGVATVVAIKKEIIDQDTNTDLYVSNIWRKING